MTNVSTVTEFKARRVKRRKERRLTDMRVAVVLLTECITYIDTTWGDKDAIPEPACAKRARAFLVRRSKRQEMAVLPAADLNALVEAARTGAEHRDEMAEACSDDPYDAESRADYQERAKTAHDVLERLSPEGTDR